VAGCPECGADSGDGHADWCLYEYANPPGDDGPSEIGVREPRRPSGSPPSVSVEHDRAED
jgi:hypothetical protein